MVPTLLDDAGIVTRDAFANESVPEAGALDNYIYMTPLGGRVASSAPRPSCFEQRDFPAMAA
jgi:hypothetical protein